MLDLPNRLALTDCQNGQVVSADLIRLTREIAQTRIDAVWWSGLGVSKSKREEEDDHHWRWTRIVGSCRTDLFVECSAVQTCDQQIQGAMVYRIDGKSILQDSCGAVHCEYLATAPRNRDWLVADPCFRGSGTGLLLRAIAHSYQLGLGGRINLFSLPTARTEQWYSKIGFVKTDLDKDGMMLFEISAEKAVGWLKERGLL